MFIQMLKEAITEWEFWLTIVTVSVAMVTLLQNSKQIKAAREQIVESQKQQRIGTGLQLYAMRKDVVDRLKKVKLDDLYYDIFLLYNQEFADEYAIIANCAERIDQLMDETQKFEKRLSKYLDQQAIKAIGQQQLRAKTESDFEGLRSSIKTILISKGVNLNVVSDIDDYIGCAKEMRELDDIVTPGLPALIDKLCDFIRNSIQ